MNRPSAARDPSRAFHRDGTRAARPDATGPSYPPPHRRETARLLPPDLPEADALEAVLPGFRVRLLEEAHLPPNVFVIVVYLSEEHQAWRAARGHPCHETAIGLGYDHNRAAAAREALAGALAWQAGHAHEFRRPLPRQPGGMESRERGLAHELRLLGALEDRRALWPYWLRSARLSTREEDQNGIDLVCESDAGELYLQVKSSYLGCLVHGIGPHAGVAGTVLVNERRTDRLIYGEAVRTLARLRKELAATAMGGTGP